MTLFTGEIEQAEHVQPIVSPMIWPAERPRPYNVMVVGAGLAGAVMAERLAADGGRRVLVVDRRPHVAGNAFDRLDDAGVPVHRYGPHIFHTDAPEIVDYLSRFTRWRPVGHRVPASGEGTAVPTPMNRATLNKPDDPTLATEADAAASFTGRAEDGYVADSFQAIPTEGFTRMFERMLDHPNIDLLLGVDYVEAREAYPHDHLVFTGPIDEYFGHCYGKLPHRSLGFRHELAGRERLQPVAVANYPAEDVASTRVTEDAQLTAQCCSRDTITYGYPSARGNPCRPIARADQALFKRYEALTIAQTDVTFVGGLATCRCHDMDQVVGQALATYRRMFADRRVERTVADMRTIR